jgi:hypothetical protein
MAVGAMTEMWSRRASRTARGSCRRTALVSYRRTALLSCRRAVLVSCLVLAGGLLLFVAGASATIAYKQSSLVSFGKVPTSVAVDNTNVSSPGDVWVLEGETKIQLFNASGTFLSTLAAPSGAKRLTVDSSPTSSAGDLYVTIPGPGFTFPPQGEIDRFAGPGSGQWVTGLISPVAVAVEGAGNVYVAEAGGGVFEFSSAGARLNEGNPVVTGLSEPRGIAVDSHGDLYVANDSAMGTVEFTPTADGGFSAPKTVDPAAALDVAVDPATEYVYIATGPTVEVFDPSGSLVGVALGSPDLPSGTYSSVAESQATQDVYATNTTDNKLELAEPEVLITTTSTSTSATTTSTTTTATTTTSTSTSATSTTTTTTSTTTPATSTTTTTTTSTTAPATSSTTTTTSATATTDTASTAQSTGGGSVGTGRNGAGAPTLPHLGATTASRSAKQLAKALRACERKPRRQRASCEKWARKRYGAMTAEKGRQSRGTGKKK